MRSGCRAFLSGSVGDEFPYVFKARPGDRRLAASLPASTPAAQTEAPPDTTKPRPSPNQGDDRGFRVTSAGAPIRHPILRGVADVV